MKHFQTLLSFYWRYETETLISYYEIIKYSIHLLFLTTSAIVKKCIIMNYTVNEKKGAIKFPEERLDIKGIKMV